MTQLPAISYRKAQDEDLEFLRQLRRLTMREVVARHHPWGDEAQEHRLRTDLDSARIIQVKGKDVGLIKVVRREDHMELMQLQLLPEWQNIGIGSMLIRELQAEAAEAALPLVLHSYATNRAIALFQRLGFEIAASTQHFRGMRWTG
jgi:ribosomal protein S18 acetylase RimI-like enzyme